MGLEPEDVSYVLIIKDENKEIVEIKGLFKKREHAGIYKEVYDAYQKDKTIKSEIYPVSYDLGA
jgi:hypothetical protein